MTAIPDLATSEAKRRFKRALLAHAGVLFLDDLPEFTRSNLEWMLQALRDGQARAGRSTTDSASWTQKT